jgi:2-phosphosulfolactate phosphatase
VTAQGGYAWRFDWGPPGLRALAPVVDAIVIVDVLRFTTAVSVAVDGGSSVVPAVPGADGVTAGPWALSPRWVGEHPAGSRLVLSSVNGGALARGASEAGARVVVAGCLRNASAVARALLESGTTTVGVIAAGERLGDSGTWRAAVEDLIGAGAVLAALDPAASISAPGCSPEAAAARAAFVAARPRLVDALAGCVSGRELAHAGFGDDVSAAAQFDVSAAVPVLRKGVFVAW